MSSIVYDAAVLVAADRNERRAWAEHKARLELGVVPLVPALVVAQVGRELDELRRFNVRSVFFVDDNLIGNLPVAKKLLQFLKDYQEKHQYWFSFGTEASLNMAQHRDLLELFRRAKFGCRLCRDSVDGSLEGRR